MSATRTLASYLSGLRYQDLPPPVVEKGKLAVLDALGNCIGGYPLGLSSTFLGMAKELGGGRAEATLVGDGSRVNVPMAAFANGALSTMLDYSDSLGTESGRSLAWMGALAVPAGLAAGESRGVSGRELVTSVVAGYECAARIVLSMDQTPQQAEKVTGSSVSVFAAAGAAARALGLNNDQFLSALGMAGMYTPVPAGYKWLGEVGLTPRKDVKQAWAWMCMAGTFAAVSAQKGLSMLQENNILDGERGLWRMLGMDVFREEALTAGLGETYHILRFSSKIFPGCAVTHTALAGVTGLVRTHGLAPDDIQSIDVVTNRAGGIGFDDQAPARLVDREFNMPFQVASALLGGEKGPGWYADELANSPQFRDMEKRVKLSFDAECDQVFRDTHLRMSKVTVATKAGQRYSTRVDRPERVSDAEAVRTKFIDTTTQVIRRDQARQIIRAVDRLESMASVSELVALLRIPG
jgi:2-methylcitrate dehydratase PrpD